MGKFGEKFLNILKLNENYDEDDFDEYDDDDDSDDDYDIPDTPVNTRKISKFEEAKNSSYEQQQEAPQPKSRFGSKQASKVIPMNNTKRSGAMEVCVIKPSTVDDGREITDTLLSGRAVVLNLEGLHVDIAQRIIDFASGSCYSIDGNLQKISSYIFIITPKSVDISGDFQDLLSGGFDVAAFKNN